jgi:hypothetical protein
MSKTPTTYIIKTLPKGVKPEGPVSVSDLTETLMATNSPGVAKSAVDGNQKPAAAFGSDGQVFSNLSRYNKRFMKQFPRKVTTIKVATKAPPKAGKKGVPPKGRFDHVKPVREVIVERV